MTREVRFSPRADADLRELYDYIEAGAGDKRAFGYVTRVRKGCLALGTFPMRGSPLNERNPDLRVVGFERRVSIVFRVQPSHVMILRVLYAGRTLSKLPPKRP